MSISNDNPLFQLKARQLMTPDVLSVSAHWGIEELASFFAEYKLSGAPVLSRDGALVGVVSTTDILRYSNNPQYKSEVVRKRSYYNEQGAKLATEIEELDFCRERQVSDIMTAHIISVGGDAGVEEITDIMSSNNIHRIFVTDEDEVVGIVSSMDIIRLVCQASKATA
ncbi:CBS domain-containing protein [Aestuariirhabdus sp. LZHN29]|uniref:CBS domain-containing protein n=1 Tax=Aestuariirhabdus sp. LZHN29 TaxID=3417462 RepID=UPI003CFA991D